MFTPSIDPLLYWHQIELVLAKDDRSSCGTKMLQDEALDMHDSVQNTLLLFERQMKKWELDQARRAGRDDMMLA